MTARTFKIFVDNKLELIGIPGSKYPFGKLSRVVRILNRGLLEGKSVFLEENEKSIGGYQECASLIVHQLADPCDSVTLSNNLSYYSGKELEI